MRLLPIHKLFHHGQQQHLPEMKFCRQWGIDKRSVPSPATVVTTHFSTTGIFSDSSFLQLFPTINIVKQTGIKYGLISDILIDFQYGTKTN
jgi:hypothetical protein